MVSGTGIAAMFALRSSNSSVTCRVGSRRDVGRFAFKAGKLPVGTLVRPATRAQPTSFVCSATVETKKDLMNPTYYPTSADAANEKKRWYIIDAEGKTLGRLACLAANYIRGKHLATYTPSMDMGAYVIVVNADKVTVTGKKFSDKTYFNHRTTRPGQYTVETFSNLQQRLPERIVERAVKGMLPKGALGRDIRLHLKVYKGTQHPHEAQQPVDISAEIDIKPKEGPGAQLLAAKKAELKK